MAQTLLAAQAAIDATLDSATIGSPTTYNGALHVDEEDRPGGIIASTWNRYAQYNMEWSKFVDCIEVNNASDYDRSADTDNDEVFKFNWNSTTAPAPLAVLRFEAFDVNYGAPSVSISVTNNGLLEGTDYELTALGDLQGTTISVSATNGNTEVSYSLTGDSVSQTLTKYENPLAQDYVGKTAATAALNGEGVDVLSATASAGYNDFNGDVVASGAVTALTMTPVTITKIVHTILTPSTHVDDSTGVIDMTAIRTDLKDANFNSSIDALEGMNGDSRRTVTLPLTVDGTNSDVTGLEVFVKFT